MQASNWELPKQDGPSSGAGSPALRQDGGAHLSGGVCWHLSVILCFAGFVLVSLVYLCQHELHQWKWKCSAHRLQ